jgi:membrane protease YdiL (CAAX protease family)
VRRRFFLLLSIAVIGASWASTATAYAFGVFTAEFHGARDVAFYVCKLTLIETTILWLLLRSSGERLANLGFGVSDLRLAARNPLVVRVIATLVLVGPVIGNVTTNLARSGVVHGMPVVDSWLKEPGTSPIVVGWVHEPGGVFWSLGLSIMSGFREELERAFCLTRFQAAFGTAGLVFAIPVDAVLFGMGHLYQGHFLAVQTSVMAVVMSVIFVRRRRVAEPMLMHAGFDVVMTLLIYALVRT